MRSTTLSFISLFLVACAADPNAPDQSSRASGILSRIGSDASDASSSAEPTKTGISGTIAFVGQGVPGVSRVTPSGRLNAWNWPANTYFDGDISGSVTFVEQVHAPSDFSDLVASGPMHGDNVTWNGRSGGISGQWRTNCVPDASQLLGLSCGGVMNARGSGGLEGVEFHFSWGPGWYPFPYTGTAFSH